MKRRLPRKKLWNTSSGSASATWAARRALSAPEPGYAPPVMIEAGGTRQLVLWHAKAINGLDPETGKVYWSVPLAPGYGMSIATPRVSGDLLFASG